MSALERIVFIGAGNMAEALVRGLLAAGVASAEHLFVTDVLPARRAHFLSRYSVAGGADNADAARSADVIVLAVKPQQMPDVCRELAGALPRDPLILSIAAGATTARIEEWLGGAARVVRAMPNTPALVGAGVTALAPGRRATAADLDRAERLLGAVGAVVRVGEDALDAVTAISGSGPAYVFYLAEAMRAGPDSRPRARHRRYAGSPHDSGGRSAARGRSRDGAGGTAAARDLEGRNHRGGRRRARRARGTRGHRRGRRRRGRALEGPLEMNRPVSARARASAETRRAGAVLRRARAPLIAAATLASLYVGALAYSRTTAFRDALAARFGRATGGRLQIGAARLNARLALELKAVEWREADDTGRASVRADAVTLRLDWPWRPDRPQSIEAQGGGAVFVQTPDGHWMPRRLSPLAESLDQLLNLRLARPRAAGVRARGAAGVATAPLPMPPMAVRLRGCYVEWHEGAGPRLALIEELELTAEPEMSDGRRATRVRVAARRIERDRGMALAHPRFEFLLVGAERTLVRFDAGAPDP